MSLIQSLLCQRCDGRGRLTAHSIDCSGCNGTGWADEAAAEDARSKEETAYRNDPARLDESEDDALYEAHCKAKSPEVGG